MLRNENLDIVLTFLLIQCWKTYGMRSGSCRRDVLLPTLRSLSPVQRDLLLEVGEGYLIQPDEPGGGGHRHAARLDGGIGASSSAERCYWSDPTDEMLPVNENVPVNCVPALFSYWVPLIVPLPVAPAYWPVPLVMV
jgi:hypothetical protein